MPLSGIREVREFSRNPVPVLAGREAGVEKEDLGSEVCSMHFELAKHQI